jgi:hypothetical protein
VSLASRLSASVLGPADQRLTSVTVGTDNTIESIFGDAWTAEGAPDFVAGLFSRLRLGSGALFSALLFHSTGSARVYRDIASTYSAGFLIQVKIRLKLHFDAERRLLSLLPPSLPPMDLASQYEEPDELSSTTFLWPWLRDGLAGTPLAGLSSTHGRRWAGYYTNYTITGAEEMDDPPMLFKLYLAPPPPADAAANKVYFRGEGADDVGSFTLEGAFDTKTGVVIAVKTYVGTHRWEWHGVITPFGMVGVWGIGAGTYGWWWIWPREWSERSPAPVLSPSLDGDALSSS